MPNVHILPEEIISKIAAGEVIERPASVIKELIENALDANASSIEVHLKDAGKQLIHVRDNGTGIEKEDIAQIFHRHATSKITSVEDLDAIHSLGFRGEALYSIGAVADVTLRTKTKNSPDAGWEIHIRGGKQAEIKPCAFAETGTEIEIRDLFFNTPARKKFLRANSAEMHQVLNTFIPYTIVHHNVRFRLSHQGKDLIDLGPVGAGSPRPGAKGEATSPLQRMADVLNLDDAHLIKGSQGFPEKNLTVKMVLGDINIKRRRRDMQFIFINNRPVFNKNISYHMNNIYRLIMAPNEFGAFALFIHMPAEQIDVNIHPTKREVKLKDESRLCSIIRSLCEQYLMEKTSGKIIGSSRRGAVSAPFRSGRGDPAPTEDARSDLFGDKLSDNTDYAYPRSTRVEGPQGPKANEFYVPDDVGAQRAVPLQETLRNARFIGAFINKYLIFESRRDAINRVSTLLLIDQHAAQERIFYEKFIQQLDKGTIEVQHLLSPVLIDLSPQEKEVFEEVKEEFDKIDLSCSMFDEETLAVHSHPEMIKDVEVAVRGILSGEKVTQFDHDTIARRACRSSIMTGDKLSREQAEHQRDELIKCLDPFTCPHGRPTVVELSEEFLDKQFLRIH